MEFLSRAFHTSHGDRQKVSQRSNYSNLELPRKRSHEVAQNVSFLAVLIPTARERECSQWAHHITFTRLDHGTLGSAFMIPTALLFLASKRKREQPEGVVRLDIMRIAIRQRGKYIVE